MALQASGQISLSDVETEFGGTAPTALSEYLGSGNAPASGEIQLAADFYGTSAVTAKAYRMFNNANTGIVFGGNFAVTNDHYVFGGNTYYNPNRLNKLWAVNMTNGTMAWQKRLNDSGATSSPSAPLNTISTVLAGNNTFYFTANNFLYSSYTGCKVMQMNAANGAITGTARLYGNTGGNQGGEDGHQYKNFGFVNGYASAHGSRALRFMTTNGTVYRKMVSGVNPNNGTSVGHPNDDNKVYWFANGNSPRATYHFLLNSAGNANSGKRLITSSNRAGPQLSGSHLMPNGNFFGYTTTTQPGVWRGPPPVVYHSTITANANLTSFSGTNVNTFGNSAAASGAISVQPFFVGSDMWNAGTYILGSSTLKYGMAKWNSSNQMTRFVSFTHSGTTLYVAALIERGGLMHLALSTQNGSIFPGATGLFILSWTAGSDVPEGTYTNTGLVVTGQSISHVNSSGNAANYSVANVSITNGPSESNTNNQGVNNTNVASTSADL